MERHKEATCHTQLKTVTSIQILILRRIYDSYFWLPIIYVWYFGIFQENKVAYNKVCDIRNIKFLSVFLSASECWPGSGGPAP